MPSIPQTCAVAAVLLVNLTGCGGDAPDPTTEPSLAPSSTSTTATPTAAGTASSDPTSPTPAATAAATSTATSSACGLTGKVVPDGTWRGPITMTVRSNDGQSGYADSPGTGRLQLTVTDGRVTSGSWSLTWKSHGVAETAAAAATVDLTGLVRGTAQGSAAKPALSGAWEIDGVARVTRPAQITDPFHETGQLAEALTIRSSTCDRVAGRFVPSVTSKEAAVTFTGTADWIGTRR